MSNDVKDAGLVAMISSILGGGKRADSMTPPPLAEVPPTAPSNGFEAVAVPALEVTPVKREDAPSTAPAAVPLLPDRPISPHPNLVTEAGLQALQSQLQQARKAYEAAQAIEDVNEKRRQSAVPLRDARYLTERLRTAQVIPTPASTDIVA